MKTKLTLGIAGLVLFGLLALGIQWLGGHPERIPYDPAYDAYLSGFTDGDISKASPVLVRFQNEVGRDTGKVLEDSPFSFSPSIQGKTRWTDSRTIEFRPQEELEPGKIYTATLDLKGIVGDIPASLRYFRFQFRCRPRKINVSPITTHTFRSSDGGGFARLSGYITTNDRERAEDVQRLLVARKSRSKWPVQWSHSKDGTKHFYSIDSLPREAGAYPVTLTWVEDRGGQNEWVAQVPAVGDFSVNKIEKFDAEGEKYLIVEFTDPIDRTQNLEGLIRVDDRPLRYLVEDNHVKVFFPQNVQGNLQVNIAPGVVNTAGARLAKGLSKTLTFDRQKPAVKLVGKGVILPRTKVLPFVFEAAGLKAVDVRIIKIFERSVPQFLQVNNLDGSQELRRVGKIMVNQRVELDKTPGMDLTGWNHHAVDLTGLIELEPGAIYEVAIGFRKSYALWDGCPPAEPETDEDGNVLPPLENLDAGMLDLNEDDWASGKEYYYYDYYDSEYDDEGDPCEDWYYNSSRAIRRNILASDLGLMAKQGSGGSFFAVTHLQTTEPLSGVELELFDYQLQSMGKFWTNRQGQVMTEPERKPFLLVARMGKQRGYLRLDDGSSLSMSRYDVQGQAYHKGIKGFLYGERGVWRPGDEMYLNFILEDENGTLPPNHPVTFELIGPRGQVVQKITKLQGLNGFYNFTCRTEPDAFTGNYTARVRVGGAVFEKNIKVETILPNRMKLDLQFGKEALTKNDLGKKGALQVAWLHGAPAKGLKADVKLILAKTPTAFQKFPQFVFDDLSRSFEFEEKTLFESQLDENGKASVPFDLKVGGNPPGMLKAIFRVRAFEPGGQFSIDRFSLPFAPYREFAGMQTAKGVEYELVKPEQDNLVRLAACDANGTPLSGRNLEVAVYKLDWRWWFDRDEEEQYAFRKALNREPVAHQQVTTAADGTAEFRYKLKEWGRFLVRVTNEEGHAASKIVYVDWPWWDQTDLGDAGGPAYLAVAADKETYTVGQTATVSIPSPNGGRALVTVESGNRVLRADWVATKQGTTTFSFPVTKEMCPNSYVTVTLLQPHEQTANDLPMRMYGVASLGVENPSSKLSPTIVAPDRLEPNKSFTVKVGEKGGGPMTYTLAVVDEGLLGLTRFKTPDPWEYFFQREALGVRTWDLFDYVLGAFKGEIRSMLSVGGDAALLNTDKPDRFKPVVLYAGPFELKKGETRSHTLNMPNYVGEVRVMVVAGNQSAYGAAEKKITVKQPLMVLATLPRTVGPNEEFSLPVTVFASEKGIQEVQVNIEAQGPIEVVPGKQARKLSFGGAEGEEMVSLQLRSKSYVGTAHLKVTVTGSGHSALYETDLSVRVANPLVTNVTAQNLEGKKTHTFAYRPIGLGGTNRATLEFSVLPPINLASRSRYLITYPYGCIEQTTSILLAQVFLPVLQDLPAPQQAAVERNVKAGIDRIFGSFMTSSGGFGYWPGASEASEWGSSYAGHFLAEAKRLGYSMNEDQLKKWLAYQKNMANNWSDAPLNRQTELQQAYRLYTLALHGQPEMGAMNRLRTLQSVYGPARWLLAASYYLSGQNEVARKMTENLPRNADSYRELSYTYGSATRDQALVLIALATLQRKEDGQAALKPLSEVLNSNQWLSTQETGMALTAVAKFIGADKKQPRKIAFSYRIGNGAWIEASADKPFKTIELPNPDQAMNVEVRNGAETMAFPRLIAEGIPLEGDNTAAANGITMEVDYLDQNGKSLDLARIGQGTDFSVRVTLHNPTAREYKEMVLHQILPSGWEIHNVRMDGTGAKGDVPTYQDIRDDRVYTFFHMPPKSTRTFTIMLNAAYLGRFYLPTLYAEAMYDRSINARTGGQWTEVVAKKTN
jgi:uncharacterized protein YfaS (alpha-2-macroglobulin family)